jgi:hypothetical protein
MLSVNEVKVEEVLKFRQSWHRKECPHHSERTLLNEGATESQQVLLHIVKHAMTYSRVYDDDFGAPRARYLQNPARGKTEKASHFQDGSGLSRLQHLGNDHRGEQLQVKRQLRGQP